MYFITNCGQIPPREKKTLTNLPPRKCGFVAQSVVAPE